eukprot:2008380-Rhodomonas_salina.4
MCIRDRGGEVGCGFVRAPHAGTVAARSVLCAPTRCPALRRWLAGHIAAGRLGVVRGSVALSCYAVSGTKTPASTETDVPLRYKPVRSRYKLVLRLSKRSCDASAMRGPVGSGYVTFQVNTAICYA